MYHVASAFGRCYTELDDRSEYSREDVIAMLARDKPTSHVVPTDKRNEDGDVLVSTASDT